MTDDIPGRLIGTGRNACVYDIGDGKVLRRYRDSRPPAAVAREAEVMRHARAHGIPVPEVFTVAGTDIVMQCATGPTMLDVLARRPWTIRAQARLLARLHTLVHAVPAMAGLRTPFGDGPALLHMDLHPQNVILTAGGPLIIDWEGAARGPGAADIAMTWVIVAFSQVDGSRLQVALVRVVQRLFTRGFLRAAGPVPPPLLEAAAAYRLRDHNLLPAEAARIRRRTGQRSGGPDTGQRPLS
jgi:aminoglycoside phosphotransferase (APT) family kinase protein